MISVVEKRNRRTEIGVTEDKWWNRRFLVVSTILRNVPLAPNPKSAMLMTINDK